jgi:imidazolonepropionase-like amidohydrolase
MAKSHFESIKKARKSNVSIAMGTDAGTPFNRHGENLKELELLLKVGFTPLEALVAATKRASELLGLERRIGTLEKGKAADLIIVDGDPLKEISLLQHRDKIMVIMREGRFYKRQLTPN